jgi:hypothetical protein
MCMGFGFRLQLASVATDNSCKWGAFIYYLYHPPDSFALVLEAAFMSTSPLSLL